MSTSKEQNTIKDKIYDLVEEFYELKHNNKSFVPGISEIPVSGKVFDSNEIKSLISSSLDFWLTDGDYSDQFSEKMSNFLSLKHVRLVNSGSSANLVSLASLTNKKIKNHILPGAEVITTAVGFPTTVNPIFQNNMTPVFVDSELGTYNPTADSIIDAYSAETKAIMMAHTLGNPLEIEKIKDFADDKNLWLIEDNCDALGSTYKGKYTGTYGDISTLSFYPAHHITMGEGGAVMTNSTRLQLSIDSFRDWGRDCWCKSGHDNTCNKRFDWSLGELPYGYDHKYTYSNIGYNLKLTDLQASIGVVQMDKLKEFIDSRRKNWSKIDSIVKKYSNYLSPHIPTEDSEPSWFGYAILVKENKNFSRDDFVKFLNERRISTRLLFGGNLIKQPAYEGKNYKVVGSLENADIVMNSTFWIGVYPGITDEMINYISDIFEEFLNGF